MRPIIYAILMITVLLGFYGCYDGGYYRGHERNRGYESQRDRDYDWNKRTSPEERFERDRQRRELPEGD